MLVEVPAVSVVKIEMIEKCFGTQRVHAHVFMDGNCTIKNSFSKPIPSMKRKSKKYLFYLLSYV
jgi:hypothetical protein